MPALESSFLSTVGLSALEVGKKVTKVNQPLKVTLMNEGKLSYNNWAPDASNLILHVASATIREMKVNY